MLLKKMRLVVAGLTLAALAACSAAGAGDPDKEKPVIEVKAPLTLSSLKVVFKDSNTPLLVFEKERTSYIVPTSTEETGLVLEYEAPENVNVEISPPEIPKYLGGSDSETATQDGVVEVDLENLPIPRKDPDFLLTAEPGVDAYSIILTLSLKPASPESTREGDTVYNWQPNTYIITIQEELADLSSEENQAKINEKIAEATQKINNLGLVVGNPADNDESVDYIKTMVSELNTLKRGTEEEFLIETRTEPDAGTSYTTRTEGTDTIYIITEKRPVYDYMAILTKAKQLNAALENSNVVHIIVDKLEIAYKAPAAENDPNVQNVEIGSNGRYKIEMAGGSGGHVWTGKNDTATGGRAAKVTATFSFTQGQKLGFRVGGEGIGTADLAILNNPANFNAALKHAAIKKKWGNDAINPYRATKAGGWNGGGTGGQCIVTGGLSDAWSWAPGSGGGGATDVRIYNGTGPDFVGTINFNAATDARIMVAAGGGGAGQASGAGWKPMGGGHAGQNGLSTQDGGFRVGTALQIQTADTGGTYTPYTSDPCPPGAPTYVKVNSAAGDNGRPGNARFEGRGGGGGGFKGGEAVTEIDTYKGASTSTTTGSGAGGSSHVKSTALNKTITLRNDQFVNGYAVIEWIPTP